MESKLLDAISAAVVHMPAVGIVLSDCHGLPIAAAGGFSGVPPATTVTSPGTPGSGSSSAAVAAAAATATTSSLASALSAAPSTGAAGSNSGSHSSSAGAPAPAALTAAYSCSLLTNAEALATVAAEEGSRAGPATVRIELEDMEILVEKQGGFITTVFTKPAAR